MNIKDLSDSWDFEPIENLKEGCEILCPECLTWSLHTEWRESSVGCELCGEHYAIKCPECDERFDHVWNSEPFECRIPGVN